MNIREGLTVLDLGGQSEIWANVPHPLNITILNLPGVALATVDSHHKLKYITGDACNVVGIENIKYDIVFSNSVIEHVGSQEKQESFAKEVRRLGNSYWVQTPSIWFPFEAHTGMPFWWFYPKSLQEHFIRRWKRNMPAWAEYIKETSVVTKERFIELFPEAHIYVETWFGIPKSYSVWHTAST